MTNGAYVFPERTLSKLEKERAEREIMIRANKYKKRCKVCSLCRKRMNVDGITGNYRCVICGEMKNEKGVIIRKGKKKNARTVEYLQADIDGF